MDESTGEPASADPTDLVVAIKTLDQAKSRLRSPDRAQAGHEALALAIATDTVEVAVRTPLVRTVLVVSADPAVAAAMGALGVQVVPDPGGGLNAALRHGATLLRERDRGSVIGALQSDLPALREADLAAAVAEAAGRRAFCADRQGTGTTLLLSTPGGALDPRFGVGSAAAHVRSGAVPVGAALAALRSDVDTAEDLDLAVELGAGPRTSKALSRCAFT